MFDLLAIHMMILSCILLTRHEYIHIYLSLLATNKTSMLFHNVYVFTTYINIISIDEDCCVLLIFEPSRFSWIFLVAYSEPKLKICGNKASPFFRPF